MEEKQERTAPYKSDELFEIILGQLREKAMLPNNLDYIKAAKESIEVPNEDIGIENTLDFGSNEGIYLDLFLRVHSPGSRVYEKVPLGTFKTLDEDRDAMRDMGKILADFICELRDFINDHMEDFTWSGYTVIPCLEDGSRAQYYVTTSSYAKAVEHADSYFKKPSVSRVFIRDNMTRREFERYKEEL